VDIGESNIAAFSNVTLNRGRPMSTASDILKRAKPGDCLDDATSHP
jgi:hypothetical protein